MTHPVHKFSSLARPVEPQYPTNLAVLILLPLIAISLFVWLVMNDSAMVEAGKTALLGMLAAFLAWALGREMDPDHNATGFIALGLTVLAVGLGYSLDLLSLAALLFAVRVINRTVGPPARLGDLVTLVLLCLGAAIVDNAWWMPLLGALALAIDEYFERSSLPQRLAIPALFAIGLITLFLGGYADFAALETLVRGWVVAVVVITVLVAINIPNTDEIHSKMDALDTPCDRRRVQIGMAMILMAGVASVLGGQASLTGALAIWAVLAASLAGRNITLEKSADD
ncbi:hypothetical protein [Hyphobacterium sp.]|uniref:hypothetical protein n=1 Tax=Hyphobacterium sp. TaxID=2004662 RepID=UPI003B52DD98